MMNRPPFPPPPQGNLPGGDADVVAFLKNALIMPVDEARAARDISMLVDAAKDVANVTPLMSRRERAFKQVAAAAAVVVVASGAGFGAAQLSGQNGDNANDTLAFETPDTQNDNTSPSTPDAPQDAPSANGTPDASGDVQTSPDTAPSAPQPSPAPAPAPAPAPDAPVGDAGDAEAIEDFERDDVATDDTCEADDTCETDDTDVSDDTDGEDPRDLLRERRFGAN